jgi:hypothetical protein
MNLTFIHLSKKFIIITFNLKRLVYKIFILDLLFNEI